MLPSDYITKGFCKERLAENAAGRATWYNADDAVKWCVMGAIRAWTATPQCRAPDRARYDALLAQQVAAVTFADIVAWNNASERTQAEVIRVLKVVEHSLRLDATKG